MSLASSANAETFRASGLCSGRVNTQSFALGVCVVGTVLANDHVSVGRRRGVCISCTPDEEVYHA
jgi:hypothetical protein